MAKKRTLAEVRWNAERSSRITDRGAHIWHILIINKSNRIERIWQKFQEQAQPVDEIKRRRMFGEIGSNRYELISCISYGANPREFEWQRVHKGTTTRDMELFERKRDGICDYVKTYLEKNSVKF